MYVAEDEGPVVAGVEHVAEEVVAHLDARQLHLGEVERLRDAACEVDERVGGVAVHQRLVVPVQPAGRKQPRGGSGWFGYLFGTDIEQQCVKKLLNYKLKHSWKQLAFRVTGVNERFEVAVR